MKKVIFAFAMFASSVANATMFLNIPGHYNENNDYVQSVSILTSNWESCSNAIVEYAKMEYVYYVGCDVKPLPDAANMRSYTIKRPR
jgi:hypothetical protein